MRRNCEGCIGKRQELCNDMFDYSATRSSIAANATVKVVLDGEVERGFELNTGIQKNVMMSLMENLTVVRCELTNQEIQARLLDNLLELP